MKEKINVKKIEASHVKLFPLPSAVCLTRPQSWHQLGQSTVLIRICILLQVTLYDHYISLGSSNFVEKKPKTKLILIKKKKYKTFIGIGMNKLLTNKNEQIQNYRDHQ